MTQAPLIWHALRTEPQRELDVAKALERFGVYARVKTESRLRKWTKWDKVRTYRTFVAAPGYCFIGMPIGVPVPWYKILRIHMIYSIVGLHGDPARFDHDEMVRFLGHEGKRLPGYFRHFRTGHEFRIGDEVIVARGVLADHKLRVQDVQDGEAHFIMRLLGRDQLVKIPVDDCVRAA